VAFLVSEMRREIRRPAPGNIAPITSFDSVLNRDHGDPWVNDFPVTHYICKKNSAYRQAQHPPYPEEAIPDRILSLPT